MQSFVDVGVLKFLRKTVELTGLWRTGNYTLRLTVEGEIWGKNDQTLMTRKMGNSECLYQTQTQTVGKLVLDSNFTPPSLPTSLYWPS